MEILTPFSLLMPAFSLVYSPRPLPLTLQPVYIAPLPIDLHQFLSFGVRFSPDNFRRVVTRPVSYYALFE